MIQNESTQAVFDWLAMQEEGTDTRQPNIYPTGHSSYVSLLSACDFVCAAHLNIF